MSSRSTITLLVLCSTLASGFAAPAGARSAQQIRVGLLGQAVVASIPALGDPNMSAHERFKRSRVTGAFGLVMLSSAVPLTAAGMAATDGAESTDVWAPLLIAGAIQGVFGFLPALGSSAEARAAHAMLDCGPSKLTLPVLGLGCMFTGFGLAVTSSALLASGGPALPLALGSLGAVLAGGALLLIDGVRVRRGIADRIEATQQANRLRPRLHVSPMLAPEGETTVYGLRLVIQ